MNPNSKGLGITACHEWAGRIFSAGQGGGGGPFEAGATALAFPLQFLLPAGGYGSITGKTTAAAAAADAGVVFYKYGATAINAA